MVSREARLHLWVVTGCQLQPFLMALGCGDHKVGALGPLHHWCACAGGTPAQEGVGPQDLRLGARQLPRERDDL